MIKRLSNHSCDISPFNAVKSWNLYNTDNISLLILEQDSNTSVALEYLEYDYNANPILNSLCSIALEQEPNLQIIYEEGILKTGIFWTDTEEKNSNGTYKRVLYNQIKTSFYNSYKNPTQILGIENIDFALSKMTRYFADQFVMLSVPTHIMGDGIVKGSTKLYLTNFDDDLEISDDSNGNLMAGINLFFRKQEIGRFSNDISESLYSNDCPEYIPEENHVSGSDQPIIDITFLCGSIETKLRCYDYGNTSVAFLYGNVESRPTFEYGNVSIGFEGGSQFTYIIIDSGSDFPTSNTIFYTGSLWEMVFPALGEDTVSMNSTFYSGSVIDVGIAYGNDTPSIATSFYSGTLVNDIIINDTQSINHLTTFMSGSVPTTTVPISKIASIDMSIGFSSGSII